MIAVVQLGYISATSACLTSSRGCRRVGTATSAFSLPHEHDMHDLLWTSSWGSSPTCWHPHEDVLRMLRGKLLPWNLSLTLLTLTVSHYRLPKSVYYLNTAFWRHFFSLCGLYWFLPCLFGGDVRLCWCSGNAATVDGGGWMDGLHSSEAIWPSGWLSILCLNVIWINTY